MVASKKIFRFKIAKHASGSLLLVLKEEGHGAMSSNKKPLDYESGCVFVQTLQRITKLEVLLQAQLK